MIPMRSRERVSIVELDRLFNELKPVLAPGRYTYSDLKRVKRAVVKEELATTEKSASTDLRLTVIDALVSEGFARHVAAERTNTLDKLEAQADRLNLS